MLLLWYLEGVRGDFMRISYMFLDYITKKIEKDDNLFDDLFKLTNAELDKNDTDFFLALRLYNFAMGMDCNYFNQDTAKKMRDAIRKKDYDSAFELVYHEYKYACVKVTMKLEYQEKKLNRQMMVPLRESISFLICACLVAFRTEGYHMANLETKGKSFVFQNEIDESDFYFFADRYYNAENCYLYQLISFTKSAIITYDYGDNWEFKTTFTNCTYFTDEEPFITLTKGNGYGIWEDNHYFFDMFLNNEDKKDDDDFEPNNIPFDFYDTKLDELKENFNDDVIVMHNCFTDYR